MSLSDKELSRINLRHYLTNPSWDHGNELLYDIVRKNFLHKRMPEVLTKVLFIGRIYAAAVERRKNKGEGDNVDFYQEEIWPTFRDMQLDKQIKNLKKKSLQSAEVAREALFLHGDITQRLYKLTKLEKRSFVSKYLHFHLPHIYFLYDSRAAVGVSSFERPAKDLLKDVYSKKMDYTYAAFFCRAFTLQSRIKKHCGVTLSPRALDNLLIYFDR